MYQCKYCNFDAYSKDDLVEHLRNTHHSYVSHYDSDDDLLADIGSFILTAIAVDTIIDGIGDLFSGCNGNVTDNDFVGGGGDFGGAGSNGDF